ncbi:hypothetical protein IE53DRAFT_391175 [Violaceomyces palustris]|uniref:Uncharacterized protein n=1 Tax=Violaceomyces palustris TaxID=1673888 RepID=A0ACD0NLH0_9BASI|nr:hypothetical protein IE53DRAFT_391175 [Violaceomyces palustris]
MPGTIHLRIQREGEVEESLPRAKIERPSAKCVWGARRVWGEEEWNHCPRHPSLPEKRRKKEVGKIRARGFPQASAKEGQKGKKFGDGVRDLTWAVPLSFPTHHSLNHFPPSPRLGTLAFRPCRRSDEWNGRDKVAPSILSWSPLPFPELLNSPISSPLRRSIAPSFLPSPSSNGSLPSRQKALAQPSARLNPIQGVPSI